MCSRAPAAFSIRPEVSSPKHSLSACLRASAPETNGEPPLAGVDLGPNHTHDLLLHLRLLGVDVGISYLAVLIPAHTRNVSRHEDMVFSFHPLVNKIKT